MAAIPVTFDGLLYDLYGRTTQRVIFIGDASLTGIGVGGGPVVPPERPPVGIWPNPPEGIAPIPEHPIVIPPVVPPGVPDKDGFLKPPPAEGGWAYHKDYAWGYYPRPGESGPK